MTVRNKSGLKAQIAALIDTAGTPRISAEDLRGVLDDMADSFDFEAMAIGQELVQRMNDAVGNVNWQIPGSGGTGVTLAQVLAAVAIDATEVDHIRMSRAVSATQVTLGLESVAVHTLTRYAAASADTAFTNTEWQSGNTSTDEDIVFPATAISHHKGFAIPASEASLTDIRVKGSPFNTRNSFAPAVGVADVLADIGGVAHKTYINGSQDFPLLAATTYTLR